MSRSLAVCAHEWGPWVHALRYTGKPELEPCVARTCERCHHRDEYVAVLQDDTAPEG